MDESFKVGKLRTKIEYPYFVYCCREDYVTNDYVRRLLKMGYMEYLKYVEKHFNGKNKDGYCEVYYKAEQDAQNAADWANSVIVMNKLVGDK